MKISIILLLVIAISTITPAFSCPDNCRENECYEDVCMECSDGYFLDEDNNCSSCSPCNTCTKNGECLSCEEG